MKNNYFTFKCQTLSCKWGFYTCTTSRVRESLWIIITLHAHRSARAIFLSILPTTFESHNWKKNFPQSWVLFTRDEGKRFVCFRRVHCLYRCCCCCWTMLQNHQNLSRNTRFNKKNLLGWIKSCVGPFASTQSVVINASKSWNWNTFWLPRRAYRYIMYTWYEMSKFRIYNLNDSRVVTLDECNMSNMCPATDDHVSHVSCLVLASNHTVHNIN